MNAASNLLLAAGVVAMQGTGAQSRLRPRLPGQRPRITRVQFALWNAGGAAASQDQTAPDGFGCTNPPYSGVVGRKRLSELFIRAHGRMRREPGLPETEKTNALDKLVGLRIRMRRRQCSISRTDLAQRLGVSVQQLARYEAGQDRVVIGRLADMASTLEVSPAYFLVGLAYPSMASSSPLGTGPEDAREVEGLLAGFIGIASPAVRQEVIEMVAALAEYSQDSANWN
ncbi:MAG: helix-turn-helix domain-containing protein [Burkholderiales bacterium]|nr:MAG: helix-turn-helix domain-containing protein [Burkholderiales bacterium]